MAATAVIIKAHAAPCVQIAGNLPDLFWADSFHGKQLKEYENEMKLNSQEIADILQYKGYIEIRENIIKDLGEITYLLSEKREIYKTYEKQKKCSINEKMQ